MNIKSIKVGHWYETTSGIGQCQKSGGTFPPSVVIVITMPLPLGTRSLRPRDVLREVPDPRTTKEAT
jgi:hypothetical protein